jgi:hypothetical protein
MLVVFLIHLLILPIVTWVLLVVVEETLASSFVQRARTLARGVYLVLIDGKYPLSTSCPTYRATSGAKSLSRRTSL